MYKKITFLLIVVLATSCGTKKIVSHEKSIKNYSKDVIKKSDSVKVNKAINDVLVFNFADISTGNTDCDSLCKKEVQRLWSIINAQKKSGDNSYSLLYDKYSNALKLNISLGETVNTLKQKSSDKENVTIDYEREEIPIKYLPGFWRWMGIVGMVSIFLWVLIISRKLQRWIAVKKLL